MITEDYCSFEVAKLLKEKGFNERCNSYFISDNEIALIPNRRDFNNHGNYLSAPTHQMAMAWLREEKNIIVNVWYDGINFNAEYYNNEDENFYLINYLCNSYEDTVEAAVKYCLENLI